MVPPYSLRSAIIGDNLDAFHAGNIPAPVLRATDRIHILIRSSARKIGAIVIARLPGVGGGERKEPNPYPPIMPATNPRLAPIIPINRASTKNSERIVVFWAPIALIVPISRIRSVTDVYNVVTIQ